MPKPSAPSVPRVEPTPLAPVAPPEECVVILAAPNGLYRVATVELQSDGSGWRIVTERPATTRAVAQAQVADLLVGQHFLRGVRQMQSQARPG